MYIPKNICPIVQLSATPCPQKDYFPTKPLILVSVFENKGNGCI